MRPVAFRSALAPSFRDFVALRKAGGARYDAQAWLLGKFDRFLAARRKRRVDASTLSEFVASVDYLATRTRENLFGVVWPALEHARRHGRPVAPLPHRPWLRHAPSRRPYVLTEEEIDRLLATPMQLSWRHERDALCPHTWSTFFALLLATGIRLGEGVALDVGDFDRENNLLVVREGKFRKMRLVPLAPSTAEGLDAYLRRRARLHKSRRLHGPLFVSLLGPNRFGVQGAQYAFRKIVRVADLKDAAGRRPRIHDLRHTFAVRRVITWHRERRDVSQLLGLLSTYMGHVNILSTQVYLQPTLELLATAAQRFEAASASVWDGTGVS